MKPSTETAAANPCPRCHGLVVHERDHHGAYATCINCGWLQPTDRYDPTGTPPPRARGKRGPRREQRNRRRRLIN